MRRTGKVPLLWAGLAVVLSSRSATAACPPLATGISLFGSIASFQETVARHTAAQGRLSDTQMWDLFTTGAITFPPLMIWPPSGPAPLTVKGRWWWFPTENPTRIEFDADGDGVAEVTETEYQELRYTYPDAGQFRATFRVRDRKGRVKTHATAVTVISPLTFDAELQGRWDTLKAALRKGDVTEALDCVHSESRSKYEKVFEALFTGASPANVNQVMTSITLVKNYDGSAIYEMLRTEAGRTLSYEVRFQVDADGVWRIRSF